MPIGNFVGCNIQSPCGIAGKNEQLIENDSPNAFFSPNRSQAELIWFQSGYISYLFPTHFLKSNINYKQISFSFELCSETVYFRNDWPSDITIWINDIEIATYTSPGDFGGRRGKYTPRILSLYIYATKNRTFMNKNAVLVGRGGFEPPKSKTSDLQSDPFGRSGICPYEIVVVWSR